MTTSNLFVGVVAAWLASGCGSVSSGSMADDMPGGDGGTGAQMSCYGSFAKICLAAAPTQALTISQATTLDTTSSPLCTTVASGGDGLCVVAASDITISDALRATGSRPLVLLSAGAAAAPPVCPAHRRRR